MACAAYLVYMYALFILFNSPKINCIVGEYGRTEFAFMVIVPKLLNYLH